jgi:hypothetical protein
MIRKLLSITFLIALPVASAFAQQKPDLTGTWKLNVAKSEFGALPGPESRTDVITHKDPALSNSVTVTNAQGKQEYTLNYTTDGKEVLNKIGERELRSTLKWAGSDLASTAKTTYNGMDVTAEGTWVLAADGKTLTISVHYASAMGETDQKLIFEKQESAPAAVPAKTP